MCELAAWVEILFEKMSHLLRKVRTTIVVWVERSGGRALRVLGEKESWRMDNSSLSVNNQSSLSIVGLQLDSDDEDEPLRGRKSFFEEGSLNDSSRSQLYDDAAYSPYHQVRLHFLSGTT
jgi:hypothetical protein